jgi:hypothetical protein
MHFAEAKIRHALNFIKFATFSGSSNYSRLALNRKVGISIPV